MALRTRKGPFTATQAGVRVTTHNRVVGSVLKAIRRRMRRSPELTQAMAAEKLGISRQQMSRWMNNPGNWTLDTVGDLMHAFDLQIEEFKVVLDEDLQVSNYVNPMSQQARVVYRPQAGVAFQVKSAPAIAPWVAGAPRAARIKSRQTATAEVRVLEPVAA